MRRIQKSGLREALKKTKGGKATGPHSIPIKVWRYLGDIAIIDVQQLATELAHDRRAGPGAPAQMAIDSERRHR